MLGALLALAILTGEPALAAPSFEDCAVLAAVGKKAFHWGETPTSDDRGADRPADFALAPDLDEAFGGGVDLTRCPWARLGVAPVATGAADAPNRFWISRPVFASGGSEASTNLVIDQQPPKTNPGMRPFFEVLHCQLNKSGGAWSVTACGIVAIS